MIQTLNNWVFNIGLILIALALHKATSSHTITYLPAPLLLSIIFTWTKKRPWRYLIWLAIFTELFSLAPAGLSTITVLTPLLVHRLRGRYDVDLSFSFLLLLIITVVAQITLQLLPLLVSNYLKHYSFITPLIELPFRPLFFTTIGTAIITFIIILATHNLKPRQNDNVISIDRQKISIIH